ncbi:alpha/beta fold hydrolase [Pseudonocardia sp. MH-G8]|uniref:alpha/beta fold hydrolase n=1 Tax=Pseudonocardia sp. MH-G8 TaxID=1854588 RepID=UPI001E383C60|nr:alpha/beta hydrolase [Pseudonocardia sp. MH-G8]
MPEEITVGPAGLGARIWRGGAGRPVLLVHGLSSNARMWDGVAARLAESGHPVVAVDLRGHGASEDVPGSGGDDLDAAPTDPTRSAAEDLAAVCADLGWAAPVVAGHAWGGNIALQLAVDRPGLVHGLALVDGGWLHLGDQFPDLDAAWSVLAPPRFEGVAEPAVRASLRAGHPEWSHGAIEGALGNLRERADGSMTPRLEREQHRAIIGSMLRHRPRTLYPRVRCRVLLLAATGDATPVRKRELLTEAASALANAEIVEFHGGDHDLHAHRPVRVAEQIASLA